VKKVTFGILSTAEIATKVCLAIQNSVNAEVLAVASRDKVKAEEWAAKHKVPIAYGTY